MGLIMDDEPAQAQAWSGARTQVTETVDESGDMVLNIGGPSPAPKRTAQHDKAAADMFAGMYDHTPRKSSSSRRRRKAAAPPPDVW